METQKTAFIAGKHQFNYMKSLFDEEELDVLEEEIPEDYTEVLEEPTPKKRRKSNKKETVEYVNKDEMWDEFHNYYKSLGDAYCWETQKLKEKNIYADISSKLVTMVNDISIKLGYRPNYLNYSYLDEMRSDAKVKMVKAIRDCSFKCYMTCKIIDRIVSDDSTTIVYLDEKFWKKHRKYKEKVVEATDTFVTKDGIDYITFRLNAFGYYSRICDNCYLNRIKKEKLADATKKAFQEETWNKQLAMDSWSNVRRPKHLDADENETFYGEE